MRHELHPLLHQRVVLVGRLNKCEANGIGSLNICLKAVDVHPWRTDAAICSLSPVRVDHGWLQMARPQHLACPVVQIYWMTAVVEPYQRRDGDADLGFRAVRSLCLDHVAQQLIHCSNSQKQLQRLEQVMHVIQSSNNYFSFHSAPERLIHNIAAAIRDKDISRLQHQQKPAVRHYDNRTRGFGREAMS